MRILYAIQGTGNGHLARAMDIYPALCAYGTVDVLVSGIQGDISLPFPITYRLYGLSFIFGRQGGIDKWATARKMNLVRLVRDIYRLPVQQYDLVINDFEPVSAWACKLHRKPCISLSHQAAVLHPEAPRPVNADGFGTWVLKNYAPCSSAYGFHFKAIDQNVFTPVIRKQIRTLRPTDNGHYTVYLPAYDDNTIVRELSVFSAIKWEVFSKHCPEAFRFRNIHVRPIEHQAFLDSIASGSGVLCGAGFETPAETLYLGKKLMVIPMKGQYEQQCNAAFLASMGVPVADALHQRNRQLIGDWLDKGGIVPVRYADNAQAAVQKVMEHFWASEAHRLRLI